LLRRFPATLSFKPRQVINFSTLHRRDRCRVFAYGEI